MCRELHPVSLSFKVAVHWGLAMAGVAPEANAPSEQSDDHQNQWEQDPWGSGAAGGP